MERNFDFSSFETLKLVVVGSSDIGISSYISRFETGLFLPQEKNTPIPPVHKKLRSPSGKSVQVQIWQSNTSSHFKTIKEILYKNASGVLLCYDITNEKSFNNLSRSVREIAHHFKERQSVKPIPTHLIGLKADLESKRQVPFIFGRDFADENNMQFFEVSSKDGSNVKESFELIINELFP